jgi:hypothetical protein
MGGWGGVAALVYGSSCRQRRCRGVHTEHTPPNISVHIGVYIGMPAAVSGGVEEFALNTRLLIYYIGVCIGVCIGACCPSAADMGVHTAHQPPSSGRYIYRYIYTDIYRYIPIYTLHRPPSSHISVYVYMYTWVYVFHIYMSVYIEFTCEYKSIIFFLSFFHLNPCRPRSRDSRVRLHTHTHIMHTHTFWFVLVC